MNETKNQDSAADMVVERSPPVSKGARSEKAKGKQRSRQIRYISQFSRSDKSGQFRSGGLTVRQFRSGVPKT
jgi:hypothetical protein